MDAGQPEDEATVEVLVPDQRRFDDFYRAEYRALLRVAWSLTGRRDLAEEAVQDAMITTHERWPIVGAYDRPGAFARRVLLNGLTSRARRRDAEKRAVARLRPVGEHVDPVPPDETFWAALRSLPPRQMHAVALHYLEDRPVAEIAEVLDLAEGTVKVHLHRGRLALAELLRDEPTGRDTP